MPYRHYINHLTPFIFLANVLPLCSNSVLPDSVFIYFAYINHRSKLMARLVYISPAIQFLQVHENHIAISPTNPESNYHLLFMTLTDQA